MLGLIVKYLDFMKTKFLLFIFFILIQTNSFSQEYVVDIEERNKMVDLYNQALEYNKNKQLEEAFSLLNTIILKDSVFRPPYLLLYGVCTQKYEYANSVILSLKKAKRIFLEDDEICFYLGEVYRINSETRNAMLEYNKAIDYSKKNGEDFPLVKSYYLSRANCYFKLNEIDSALFDYNYSIKLGTNSKNAFLNRGICLFKKGNLSEACEDWEKSWLLGNTSAKEYIEKHCKNSN
jgi:tetratricopeptide (TPR) repeat protein